MDLREALCQEGRQILMEDGELRKALQRLDRHLVRYWRNCTFKEVNSTKAYTRYRVSGNKEWSAPFTTTDVRYDPETSLDKQHAKVTCSCKQWKYMGPDYNAQARNGDYLLFGARSNGQAPDIRDANRRHTVCKHVYAVLNSLLKGPDKSLAS